MGHPHSIRYRSLPNKARCSQVQSRHMVTQFTKNEKKKLLEKHSVDRINMGKQDRYSEKQKEFSARLLPGCHEN